MHQEAIYHTNYIRHGQTPGVNLVSRLPGHLLGTYLPTALYSSRPK